MTDDATISALKYRIATLEDALRPFADALERDKHLSFALDCFAALRDTTVGCGITLDDLLLARDVLRRVE
jgi:hypothetical protein